MNVGNLTHFCFFPGVVGFVSTGTVVSNHFCVIVGVAEFVSTGTFGASKLNDFVRWKLVSVCSWRPMSGA